MNNVIACSATWEAHLRSFEDMFRALQTAGLTLQPSKIHFGPQEVQYPGHVLSADGIRMGKYRIKAIIDLKVPTTIKELRSVLGTVNLVRKFIPNLAPIIEPLVALFLLASQLKIYRQCKTIGDLNRTLLLSK